MQNTPNESYYQRRRWGIALVAIGLSWLLFSLLTSGSWLNFNLGNVEQSAPISEQAFRAERVVFEGNNDRVTIIRSADEFVMVNGDRRGSGPTSNSVSQQLNQIELRTNLENGVLTISVERRPGLSFPFGSESRLDLTIAIPQETDLDIRVNQGRINLEADTGNSQLRTVNGSITVEDSSGALDLQTVNGKITVDDHRGSVRFNSTNGSVEISGDEIVMIEGQTTNGSVKIEESSGPINVSTNNGRIEIDDAHDAILNLQTNNGRIDVEATLAAGQAQRLETRNGAIRLDLHNDPGLLIDARSTTGRIEIDLPLRNETNTRREVLGQTGDGSTQLELRSTSGRIELKLDD